MSGRGGASSGPDLWQQFHELSRRMGEAERNHASVLARFEAHEMNCEERGERVEERLTAVQKSLASGTEKLEHFFDRALEQRQKQYWSLIGLLLTIIGGFLSHDILHWP